MVWHGHILSSDIGLILGWFCHTDLATLGEVVNAMVRSEWSETYCPIECVTLSHLGGRHQGGKSQNVSRKD